LAVVPSCWYVGTITALVTWNARAIDGCRAPCLIWARAREWPRTEFLGGMVENLLQVKNLTIRYRSTDLTQRAVVASVSFDIARGETLGVMGESGCGKTSIALALLGLLSRENAHVSGSALFRGEDLLAISEKSLQKIRGAAVSMVYQEPSIALSPVMRVGTQIAEIVRAHRKYGGQKCREEAFAMLGRVGLPSTERIFSAYPHQLSGGQLQRIVLAQALACQPALLIADEPTASLDAQSRADFIALLRELKQSLGISLLLISHTPEIQASLADRMLVMKDGKIVEIGRFEDLYRNPSHPYTRALLVRKGTAALAPSAPEESATHGHLVGTV
jgi:ABC-type glutathione transport system ATPase component